MSVEAEPQQSGGPGPQGLSSHEGGGTRNEPLRRLAQNMHFILLLVSAMLFLNMAVISATF
jgi:hypothetical protein